MKILQTIKYYHPSKGGMESVAKNIVDGIVQSSPDSEFTIYANNHEHSYRRLKFENRQIKSIKEITPFIFKSQPLNFWYPILEKLILEADIVHHHYPFPNMELALLRHIGLLKGKKFIITWHANIGNSRWRWIDKFYTPVVRKLLDLATYIVVTSPQLANASNILDGYKDKIKIIPLTFDPLLISTGGLPREFPSQRKFRLLFVGKLRTYKGLKYLIRAIEDIDVELYIVGDGEDKKKLIEQTKRLNVSDKITFMSGLLDEELGAMYKKCDLFVLPSINEAEAFGVVQLEAMSNGLPVINTQLNSGVPFVSLHNVSGLTVKPKDIDELKSAIKRIISDKDLYETSSKNALIRSREFSREKMVSSYLDLYTS